MNCLTCNHAPCTCAFTAEPYCDQCGNETPCTFKLDAACVFFHWKCTNPVGLPNLGITCNTSLEEILEILDDLVGNNFNIPFEGQESETISWVMGGVAGHKPTAQVKVSEDDNNIISIHDDGIYASAGEPDTDDIILLFNDEESSGCITIVVEKQLDGKIHIIPRLDMACLIAALAESSAFCLAVTNCVELSQATVTLDCPGVEIAGTFVLGEASTGSVTIPVTITGQGTITILITSSNGEFYGTVTQVVDESTTTIIVPLEYTGDGINGTIELAINIFDSANTVNECNADAEVDTDGSGCIDVSINTTQLPDASQDVAYNFAISLNGTSPFSLINIVKPSWMTIGIVGGNVTFTGTPDSGDLGTGIVVSFDVTNCASGSDSFADTIDVIECYGCGDSISMNTDDMSYHNLGKFPLCVEGDSVTIHYDSFDRPNRFKLYDNGVQFADSGWAGSANYSGPWGASLITSPTGDFIFVPVVGHVYEIQIEVGPGSPVPADQISDSFQVTITCS